MPADSAVVMPDDRTVATAGLEDVHTPPVTVFVSVVLLPTHRVEIPDITPATGSGLTVIV